MEYTSTSKIKGQVQISVSVVEKVAKLAALEIDGVKAVADNSRTVRGALSKVNLSRPVQVEIENGTAEITISLLLKAGVKVPVVCRNVQRRIKGGVQSMTGITVSKVNVVVCGVEAVRE